MYRQKGDFIRFVCVKIAAAADKMKMSDCRVSRLEGKQGKLLHFFFFFFFFPNKTIYHAQNVNRWKSLGETSTFHRFTNPRRDISFCFVFVIGYSFTISSVIP